MKACGAAQRLCAFAPLREKLFPTRTAQKYPAASRTITPLKKHRKHAVGVCQGAGAGRAGELGEWPVRPTAAHPARPGSANGWGTVRGLALVETVLLAADNAAPPALAAPPRKSSAS